MDITFCVPHLFCSASNPALDSDARRILSDCLVRLNHSPTTNGIGPAQYWVNGRFVVWIIPEGFGLKTSYDENARVLRILLDCLIELNMSYLKLGGSFSIPKLYDSGVYYARTVIWDTIPALYSRGFGDCKSLTAALVTQYLSEGVECAPVFRFVPRESADGSLDFHILVQVDPVHSGVHFEDPSKVLGMGRNENAPIRGLKP